MKTKDLLSTMIAGVIAFLMLTSTMSCKNTVASVLDEQGGTENVLDNKEDSSFYCVYNDLPMEDLSQEEIDGLMFMREEEKLARDVYLTLHEVYGLRNMENISKSEQAHMDAIKYILDKYQLNDPVEGNDIGEFKNEELQKLYDNLVEEGKKGRTEALKVGALIEETDILDIQHELDEVVDNQDITRVYSNLIRGSKNHLRSFVRVLGVNGVDYEPVLLNQEYFDEIMDK